MRSQVALHLNVTGTHNLDNQGVIEIDATKLKDNKEVEHFHRVLNPNRTITKSATQFHDLHNNQKEIQQAPKFNTVALDFLRFVKDTDVIMRVSFLHHLLNVEFDRLKPVNKFFTAPGKKHLMYQCHSVSYICDMFKELHPTIVKPDLDTIAGHYGVTEDTASKTMVKVIQEMNREKMSRNRDMKDEKHVIDNVKHEDKIGLYQLGM